MIRKILKTFVAVALLATVITATAHAAGSASYTLSPNSGTFVQNSGFSVQVHENGTNVYAVTSKLSYDASKLTCTGVGGGSTAFPNDASAPVCGGGSVTISRYSQTPTNGDQIVGTINFTALASSGSTNVNFAPGSQITSTDSTGQVAVNIWDGGTNGGTYSFKAPAGTQPTSGGGSTTSGTTSGTSSKTSTGGTTSSTNKAGTTTTTGSNGVATTTNSTDAKNSPKILGAAILAKNQATTPHSSNAGKNWAIGGLVVVAIAGVSFYLVKRTHMVGTAIAKLKQLAKVKTA